MNFALSRAKELQLPEALIQVALMFSVCLARNQPARAFKAAHRRMKLIHRQDFFNKSMQMAYKPKRRKNTVRFWVLNSASPVKTTSE
ncbi:hypothetical protein [Pandoraea pnomenusa]|uniref:hypothetical protein n=1 Tax=Pandoraea pnomenusa TaxID=93220 RepID=UPI0007BCA5EB|nr:hypothetical protein [Pandoraea pnomenusa]ANC47655.1 hypothetical protein A6P55_25410 [Pandoraea pnomenusa]